MLVTQYNSVRGWVGERAKGSEGVLCQQQTSNGGRRFSCLPYNNTNKPIRQPRYCTYSAVHHWMATYKQSRH